MGPFLLLIFTMPEAKKKAKSPRLRPSLRSLRLQSPRKRRQRLQLRSLLLLHQQSLSPRKRRLPLLQRPSLLPLLQRASPRKRRQLLLLRLSLQLLLQRASPRRRLPLLLQRSLLQKRSPPPLPRQRLPRRSLRLRRRSRRRLTNLRSPMARSRLLASTQRSLSQRLLPPSPRPSKLARRRDLPSTLTADSLLKMAFLTLQTLKPSCSPRFVLMSPRMLPRRPRSRQPPYLLSDPRPRSP